ncbi:E7 protein [Crocuta crocuta papillomavirus 1]|uniref:Protein E7 n=1 Tax=Crocuta crocuta papillomavirus 1 TaxID=1104917 RepID=J7EZQ8_9PAPI|nr:E7 protein [Crocuta crocuta papillomavirus 1]AER38248.1 E7 protein [Crocuta crocuta papillomavirus 1]
MRGERPTLQEIVLTELPEHIDLECHEQMPEEEEEEEPISRDCFRVATCCGYCRKELRFLCLSSAAQVRSLESLLLQDFSFICTSCVVKKKLNHGG